MRTFFLVAVFVLLSGPANAQTWVVDYTMRADISQTTEFYGTGAYLFLRAPENIPVYLQSSGWQYQG